MIDREDLKNIKNILTLDNESVSIDKEHQIMTHLRKKDLHNFYTDILDYFKDIEEFKNIFIELHTAIRQNDNIGIFECANKFVSKEADKDILANGYINLLLAIKESDQPAILDSVLNLTENKTNTTELRNNLYPLLRGIKENDILKFYIHLFKITNPNLNTVLLDNVLKAIKIEKKMKADILDSFSDNQIAAKTSLIESIKFLKVLNKDSTVIIWGSWYGSILVPLLANQVKKIICLDLDSFPVKIGKKKFFHHLDNVDFQCVDIFEKYLNVYKEANLIINTSCEHMNPMKDWKWFQKGALSTDSQYKHKFSSPKFSDDCWFAFQSNDMFGIEGHINCVNNLQEFKEQLPERAEVRYADEVEDTRGTRFMVVGKFMPL